VLGPLAHLDIARQRHADLIREAERHRLAARARAGRERAGIVSRLLGLLQGRGGAGTSGPAALRTCSKGRTPRGRRPCAERLSHCE